MHLVFDIFQGIGVAAAVGIRPFLPALVVGALGAGDVQIDFAHTSYSFLQQAPFLLVMVVGVALLAVVERRPRREMLEGGRSTLIARRGEPGHRRAAVRRARWPRVTTRCGPG